MTDVTVYPDAVQTYDLNELRHKADDWLSYACGYSRGRVQSDPVYKVVVENRDPYPKRIPFYSSCGDLAHWLLFRLGVRETWINRREHANYKIGANVSRLCYLPTPVGMCPAFDRFHVECGDIVVIWAKQDTSDAHVVCVINYLPDEQVLLTAEYGQPGGALRRHKLTVSDGRILIGKRFIQRVLPLEKVLAQAAPHGRLVAPEEPPQLTSEGVVK